MTPFLWSSRTSETNLYWHKAHQWFSGAGVREEVNVEGCRGDGNVLYLDCGDGYMVYTCQSCINAKCIELDIKLIYT